MDIALAVNAEGIHIGQKDLPLVEVKKIIPKSMIVGVSVQTEEQALVAQKEGADYIGVGTVFFFRQLQNLMRSLCLCYLRKIVQAVSYSYSCDWRDIIRKCSSVIKCRSIRYFRSFGDYESG